MRQLSFELHIYIHLATVHIYTTCPSSRVLCTTTIVPLFFLLLLLLIIFLILRLLTTITFIFLLLYGSKYVELAEIYRHVSNCNVSHRNYHYASNSYSVDAVCLYSTNGRTHTHSHKMMRIRRLNIVPYGNRYFSLNPLLFQPNLYIAQRL